MDKTTIKPIIIFLLIVAGAVFVSNLGPLRLKAARKAAEKTVEEAGICLDYIVPSEISSKEEFLTQIGHLAIWETNTRSLINETFDLTDKDLKRRNKGKSGYEKKEELLSFAFKEKWLELRETLTAVTEDAVNRIYEATGDEYGIDKEDVLKCYRENHFVTVSHVMISLERGNNKAAFKDAESGLCGGWGTLSMDIAYGLMPEKMTDICRQQLTEALHGKSAYFMEDAAETAEKFSERYGETIEGIQEAKSKAARITYQNKAEKPYVGMSVTSAKNTKLGAPSRVDEKKITYTIVPVTYGTMYWEKGGVSYFKADYKDGKITEVVDYRTYPDRKFSYGGSSGSSKSSFDPDDHDIEAYYADNRDVYDDYDDAYDGFLDDEGAWDDY